MSVFRQLHEIVYHGNGGYDWETVYNMPLWLRRFTFNEIQAYHNKRNKQEDEDVVETTRQNIRAAGFDRSSTNQKIPVPDYVTKAGKK